MIIERYRRSPHWPILAPTLDDVVSLFDHTDRLADIAEASTLGILRQLGWTGTTSRSSQYTTNTDRTQRLLDLTASVHATTYLCGRGGIRYLDPTPFTTRNIDVATLATPATELWTNGYRLSAIDALMTSGDSSAVCAIAQLPIRPASSPPSDSRW